MINDALCSLLLVVGGLFSLLASIGLLRMPDLFMRMQAATKAVTLGAGCILLAVALHFGRLDITTRCLLIIAFVVVTAPIAAHVIGRAAYAVGIPLWEGTLIDEIRTREKKEEPVPPSDILET